MLILLLSSMAFAVPAGEVRRGHNWRASYTNVHKGQTDAAGSRVAEMGALMRGMMARLGGKQNGRPWRLLSDAGAIIAHTVRRFSRDGGFIMSGSLTYTTLLALVPLLTVTFAIFTAFPAYRRMREQAESLLFQTLVPQVGDQVQSYASTFMANAGALTGFGAIGLFVTSILLFFSIETAFNRIWRQVEPRAFVTRLLSFWAVLTMTPLLMGASLSVGAGIVAQAQAAGAPGLTLLWTLVTFAAEVLAYSVMYLAIPNRDVRVRDALAGGTVAALLTEISKAGFVFYVTLFPTYASIYGALSVVPIFLFWLYTVWSVVLFGAELTATLPEWRAGRMTEGGADGLLSGHRLVVALAVLAELHRAAKLGVGVRRETLAARIPVGSIIISDMLESLRAAHWVDRTSRNAWIASRDLHQATLDDLRRSLNLTIRGDLLSVGRLSTPWQPEVARLLADVDTHDRQALSVSLATIFAMQEKDF
ncbi:YihY family inner membrane protein [Niveispirillum sp. SYP-B3756]|uniref:YihY family inner membrane protein n=1 Tax=Niveispirillum sp. SYP-B3756 TaxID=2662178 RepID=UPI0015660345|nr:YihY family inner membrane protein [Niveispirillum sp. SYP-B3756]